MTQKPHLVSIEEIQFAQRSLPPLVRRTPLWPCSPTVESVEDQSFRLKLENLQVTGSYKVRAAFTIVAALDPDARERGIVLTSSGNFSQAFALAGRHYSIPICVVMLASSSPYKVCAARALGAEVDLFDGDPIDRQNRVVEIGKARGFTIIDTWEERPIIAGHGTIGTELIDDWPDVEQVLVPVSSGGMAAGTAAAIKQVNPRIRVVGVQPRGANAAFRSLQARHPVSISDWNSIADGLSARRPGEYPFEHLQRFLDEIVLVDEVDIAVAHMVLRHRAKVVAEPAGAVAASAYLSNRVDRELKTVAVVTGGNVTEESLRTLEGLARGPFYGC